MHNSHYFKEVSYDNNHDEVRYLIIKLNTAFPIYNAPYWKFDLESKEILINHKKISTFFYPDFSDLNKLKNKLKICIAFS
tara:strand:- start:4752 stop:4991 length:240 start_codon:yes stop_codon:yes gene_type:complete